MMIADERFLGPPEFLARSQRPDFVGEHWCDFLQGLSYVEPSAVRDALSGPGISTGWKTLLQSFEKLKQGQFAACTEVLDLALQSSDDDLRICAIRLLGHSADRRTRLRLPDFYSDAFSLETREEAYRAAVYAADLAIVPALLDRFAVCGSDERTTIAGKLVDILGSDRIDYFAEVDHHPVVLYCKIAREQASLLSASVGTGAPVLSGELLDVDSLLYRISSAGQSSGRDDLAGEISVWLDVVEAMTGIASVGIFDDDMRVDLLALNDFVVEARARVNSTPILSGRRYFFGHVVRD